MAKLCTHLEVIEMKDWTMVVRFRDKEITDGLIERLETEISALSTELTANTKFVVIDCEGVLEFPARLIIRINALCRKASLLGGNLIICNTTDDKSGVLQRWERDGRFKFADTQKEAIRSLHLAASMLAHAC